MDEENKEEIDEGEEPIIKIQPFVIPKKVVFIGCFVIIIIMLLVVVIALLINENSQCTANPFVYGASKIEVNGETAKTDCSCTIFGGGEFWFDEEEVYTKDPLLSNLGTLK